MVVNSWADVSDKELSESVLRERFPAASGYRMSVNFYGAHEKFPICVGWKMTVYVIKGNCRYSSSERELSLSSGQFLEILPGMYGFEVSDFPVHLVKVFGLPTQLGK